MVGVALEPHPAGKLQHITTLLALLTSFCRKGLSFHIPQVSRVVLVPPPADQVLAPRRNTESCPAFRQVCLARRLQEETQSGRGLHMQTDAVWSVDTPLTSMK